MRLLRRPWGTTDDIIDRLIAAAGVAPPGTPGRRRFYGFDRGLQRESTRRRLAVLQSSFDTGEPAANVVKLTKRA